jgi:hypothetical protein
LLRSIFQQFEGSRRISCAQKGAADLIQDEWMARRFAFGLPQQTLGVEPLTATCALARSIYERTNPPVAGLR